VQLSIDVVIAVHEIIATDCSEIQPRLEMMRIHSRSAVNSRTTALLPATSVRQSSAKSKLQTVTLLTPNMTLDFVNKLQQSKPLTGASDNVTS